MLTHLFFSKISYLFNSLQYLNTIFSVLFVYVVVFYHYSIIIIMVGAVFCVDAVVFIVKYTNLWIISFVVVVVACTLLYLPLYTICIIIYVGNG